MSKNEDKKPLLPSVVRRFRLDIKTIIVYILL